MAYQVWSEIIGGDWSSPRISFSHDLSQTDRISPDKRTREDHADNYSTEFEFCMINSNAGNSFLAEAVASADELFVDGKILPGIQRTAEPAVVEAHQPITIAHHLSLESARCTSPVRSSSYPPPRTGNASSKSSPRSSNKWKEMFRLSKENSGGDGVNNNICGEAKTGCSNVKQSLSPKSLWPFSRSSSMGGESKTNSLFCSLPFPRSNSAGERKTKISVSSSSMSMPMPMPSSTSSRIINSVEVEAKAANLAAQSPGRSQRPGRTRGGQGSPPGNGNFGRGGSPGRIGSGRYMIRNLERCSAKARDSPRPGRQFEGGFLKPNSYSSSYPGGVRVNPVLNVPVCMGPSNKNVLFNFRGLFSKKDKKSTHPNNNSNSSRKKGG